MATTVLTASKVHHVSKPLPITSHSRRPNGPPEPSSSRLPPPMPSAAADVFSSTSTNGEGASKSIQRFLESTFRSRSKKAPAPVVDEFATITSKAKKGKDRESADATTKENILRKVTFRGRSNRAEEQSQPAGDGNAASASSKQRVAGKTSYMTPSLRQASMSSPALHLSSQALPSPRSQPAALASSSSNADVLASPARPKARRVSLQPPPSGAPPTPTRHRSTRSTPMAIPASPSSPSLPLSASPDSLVPSRSRQLPAAAPQSPTRSSTRTPSKISTTSSASASAARAASPPGLGRAPSGARARIASPSRLVSSSTSHLPLPSSPSPTPRRPSIDRPSLEARRSSGEYTRRAAALEPSSSRLSPTNGDSASQVRPRSRTPSQRVYSQNRHVNMSTGSLLPTSNAEHREALRSATSMLCKEILKPPPHMAKTDAGMRDWEEVEVRTSALVRLERMWSRNATPSSPVTMASGEDRERRLFCEALRDGFVLCQLLNKQRASSVVRPDPREDGFRKTSNITKFLAGCASYGLPSDDLFLRDDLIEATSESLARVARTIVALIQFVESPQASRRLVIDRANRNKQLPKPLPPSPYGTLSKSSSSTPNLVSPLDLHYSLKRYSPPSGLPPVRSYSPGEDSSESNQTIRGAEEDDSLMEEEEDEEEEEEYVHVPIIRPPPPRPVQSPLRRQLSVRTNDLPNASRTPSSPIRASIASSTQATIGDASIRESSFTGFNGRQSLASSLMTTTTALSTTPSSLMDGGNGSSFGNKYSTIRTVTTDMTSCAPSLSREEGDEMADKLSRSPPIDVPMRNKRRSGEAHNVDLSRVAEETDDTASSGRTANGRPRLSTTGSDERQRPSRQPINLRKGKWPDDFFDAMPENGRSITHISTQELENLSRAASPTTRSPRKIAVVGDNSLSTEGQRPGLPRRPTHRPRHSVDTPGLMPRDSPLLRDASPEGGLSISPSGRVMIRRHSSKPATPRSASLAPRSDSRGSDESLVPFPRATSGDASNGLSASPGTTPVSALEKLERPRLRQRFQSDVQGSKGRGRPTSYDDVGAGRPFRGRIESMVSMGVTSAATSASDLLAPRDSMDGSTGRALVVKEEGKPPTHFQLGNCIGRGQFGSVYRALNLNTGQMVAVKRIRLEGLKEEEVTQLMREVDLVKSLSHPSIVKYEGMARDDDTLSIVLEYAENGSLGQTLKAFGKFNERLAASYVVKILEGLHYLHNSHVVHCDLKAANILTTKNGNVKLSDFGVSLNLRAMEREMKDVAGTPNWMAPEVIELKGASEKSDIWSLGCTVIELLTGRPPYSEISNSMSVMFRIVEDDIPPLPEGCSELLQDFLKQCLQKDPNDRPTAELLCEHEWLKESWLDLKDLRPQDSIPFLRRVSTDMAKTDVSRYFAQAENDPPMSAISEKGPSPPDAGKPVPVNRRPSNLSVRPPPDNDIAPRDHNFVKTTFSKPMMCRVCLLHVKKSAVLCAQCSLISHARCASSAPPTCDLRAQLLLYAQYAEKGNPASAYHNPADILGDNKFPVALSEIPYIPPSSSSNDELQPPTSPHAHDKHSDSPPTAFKFINFKRSRSNLTPEPSSPTTPTVPELDRPRRRKVTLLHKRSDRPRSLASESGLSGSLRSAATAAESVNSGSGGRWTSNESSSGNQSSNARRYRSGLPSTTESEINGRSSTSYFPSEVSNSEVGLKRAGTKGGASGTPNSSRLDTQRHKRNAKSSGNCVIQ